MRSSRTVVICPNDTRRRLLTEAIGQADATVAKELGFYPEVADALNVVDVTCEAIIVEVDSDFDTALTLVEHISLHSATTVMVLSRSEDPGILVRCMRAGAREFLKQQELDGALGPALGRAAARRAEAVARARSKGRLLVFWGAKGGVGVTTLASNFAIAIHKETEKSVALVDFNLQLGGVSLLLGLTPQFTVLDAVRHAGRLDKDFVAGLMTTYRPGLSVLAASDEYMPSVPIEDGTLGKVSGILREQHAYVVVDTGPGLGHSTELLLEAADVIYVVAQTDIPSLRNAQRFIAHRQRAGQKNLEVVLNRFEPRKIEFDEDRITRSIGIMPKWKIPNDYGAVRRSQNTGSPAVLENSQVSRAILQMARAVSGKPVEEKRKSRLKFLGL